MKRLLLILIVFLFILGIGLWGCGKAYKSMGISCQNLPVSVASKSPEWKKGAKIETAGNIVLAIAGGGTLALIIYNLTKKKSDDE